MKSNFDRLPPLLRSFLLGTVLLFAGSLTGWSQAVPTMDRRPQATRAALEASLVEIEKIIASPAFGSEIKKQKRAEAALIQARLGDGDFQVGDQLQVTLSVATTTGGSPINGPFVVGPDQMLTMQDIPPIPLRGVLRSELKDYLTDHLRKLFKDQAVQVTSTIRLTIMGGIGSPGFYQLSAETTLPDAIMAAGGPGDEKALEESVIRRSGVEIWGEEDVAAAITAGFTLDQMNLRAGDELIVGRNQKTNLLQTFRTYLLIPSLITGVIALLRLVGII